MKHKVILVSVFSFVINICFAQQNSTWIKWSQMFGEWKGSGNGKPGQGGGTFSFKTDLSDKILVQKSHSEYPAAGNKPAIIHDDLMIVYADPGGDPSKAVYFDNEGHHISYTITYPANTIVLLSDKIPGAPVFRLTYNFVDEKTLNTKFEISQDGEKFMTYIEGKSVKL